MLLKEFFRPAPLDRSTASTWADLASLVLRAGLAGVFLYHGLDKVFGENNAYGANWMATWFDAPPHAMEGSNTYGPLNLCIAWGEVVGGAALALGLLTRLAAVGMIIIQGGATFFAITNQLFSMTKHGGPEYNFVLLSMCLALLLLSGGRYSLDGLFQRSRKTEPEAKPAAEPAQPALVPAEQ